MSNVILRADNVAKSYAMGDQSLTVLTGASLSLETGDFLAIMGASGSGKSTLLHILGALDSPDSGEVWFDGLDVFALNNSHREHLRCHDIGFIFQFYYLLPELSLLENVLIPRMVSSSLLGWIFERRDARAAATDILDRVKLSHRLTHRPNELSGGERQRAAIARALVNNPQVLLADEPTGNLDRETGEGILELLAELNRAGQTIVVVTHDDQTAEYAHRRVTLEGGRIKSR